MIYIIYLIRYYYTNIARKRLPAELKHITKRRKRNQKGFP